jgi:hypothetical protein
MVPGPPLETPVLLIGYRRVSTTRKVIESLRGVRPRRVFFSVNGPNPATAGEEAQCQAVRELAGEIDWDCRIERLFRKEHLSARDSIAGAITWFFDNVEEGIVLEDDCVCDPSFFFFSQELLERYRDNPRIMQIGATNFVPRAFSGPESYAFSNFAYIWGWASWRRAWTKCDLEMSSFSGDDVERLLESRFTRAADVSYWRVLYGYLRSGNLNTWDGQWNFSVFRHRGLSVIPRQNLVHNIGFGELSTNTTTLTTAVGDMQLGSLQWPLVHPDRIEVDRASDEAVSDTVFGVRKSYRTFHLKMRIASRLSPQTRGKLKKMLGW